MTKSPLLGFGVERLLRGLALLCLALLVPAAEAAEPKEVLIINSLARDYRPFNEVGLGLRADLARQLRQPVVFREVMRFSLARELHDDLTQRLARLAIDAGRLEPVLDDLGLVEASCTECDRVARHGDLRVEVNANNVPDSVPSEAPLYLFRVAQDPARSRARASLGLASMGERVRLLHGRLDIENTLGRGTTVVAWVPA